jgi:hypothetical protein
VSDQPGGVEKHGLPPDLFAILRDQSVIVPQDQAVFEKIAEWRNNSLSNTARPLTAEEWERAWTVTVKRLLKTEAQLARCREALEGELGTMRELEELGAAYTKLRKQVQPDYVEYTFYSLPGARAALASPGTEQPDVGGD